MSKSESKNRKSASRSTASTSGSTRAASNDVGAASGSARVALDNHIREFKHTTRKLFGTKSVQESEAIENEHTAGMANDFAHLLNVTTDCKFFQFKSEKMWEEEAESSTFSCQKFFNLDLEILSLGLECVPLYDKIIINKGKLPDVFIKKSDQKAGEATQNYEEIKEIYLKEMENNLKFSKSFEDLTGIKWELRKPKVVEPKDVDPMLDEIDQEAPHRGKFWLSHRTELKEKGDDSYLAPSSSSDESLEIWLDTYLDD